MSIHCFAQSVSGGHAERQHWRDQVYDDRSARSTFVIGLVLELMPHPELTDSTNMAQGFAMMPVMWSIGGTVGSVTIYPFPVTGC